MDQERNIRLFYFMKSEGFSTHAVVKALLAANDLKQKKIAKQNQILEVLVSQVISGIRKTPKGRAAISWALGIPVRELFGDFDGDFRNMGQS